MKLTEKAVTNTHRLLLYGPPKSGKTTLAGQLSEYKKILWFDLENGYSTLLKFPAEWKDRIEIVSIPDTKSFPIAIETILKVVRGGKVTICEEHGKASCPVCTRDSKPSTVVELNALTPDTIVVVDSLTQLTQSAISHITKGKDEEYKMQTDDWGSLAKLIDTFLSHIQQATYNIICITHEVDQEKDEKSPEKLTPIAGSRPSSRNSAKFFTEVIRCEVRNMKHRYYSVSTSAMNFIVSSSVGFDISALPVPSLAPLFLNTYAQSTQPTSPTSPTQTQVASSALQKLLQKGK